MKKQIVFILLVLLMLGTVLFFYVHNILLPAKIKQFLDGPAQEYLGRKVTIDDIQFKAFEGFTFNGIKIYEENGKDILLQAESLHFNVLFAALFKQKAFIIPALTLNNPSLYLHKPKEGPTNLRQWIKTTSSSKNKGDPKYSFIIRKMIIQDGELDYADKRFDAEFFDSFEKVQIEAAISLDKSIHFQARGSSRVNNCQLALKGSYGLNSKELSLKSKWHDVPVSIYLPLFWKSSSFNFENVVLSSENLAIKLRDKTFELTGDIRTKDAKLQFKEIYFSGSPSFSAMKLHLTKDSFQLAGAIRSDIDVRIDNKDFLSAKNMLADNLTIQLQNNELKMRFDADLNDMNLIYKDNSWQCTELGLDDLRLKYAEKMDIKAAQGQCSKSSFSLAGNRTLDSDFQLNNVNFLKESHDFQITSAANLNDVIYTDTYFTLNSQIYSPSATLRFSDNVYSLDTTAEMMQTFIKFRNGVIFEGHPKIQFKAKLDETASNIQSLKGQLELAYAKVSHLKMVDTVDSIKGKIVFDEKVLTSKSLQFSALDAEFSAKGSLSSFKKLNTDVELRSDKFDLIHLEKFVPELVSKYPVKVTGLAALDARYTGSLKKLERKGLNLKSNISQVNINFRDFPFDMKNISASLHYVDDKITWKDMKVKYKSLPISSFGSLEFLPRPRVITEIESDILQANAALTFIDKTIHLDELKGRYSFTTFNGIGQIETNGESSLSLKGKLNLEDYKKLPDKTAAALSKIMPLGTLNYQASYQGSLKKWKEAAIAFDALSPSIRLADYPLNNPALKYRQVNGLIELFNLNATVYQGALNIEAQGSLQDKDVPFKSLTKIEQLNLIDYRKDKKTKNRLLSGKADTIFTLSGDLLNVESYRGTGSFQITEAYLGELIPQVSAASFTGAAGEFEIRSKKIFTDKTRITSDTLDLIARGWVDFDKNINFDIIPALKNSQMIDTGRVKIDPSILLSEAINIKMTGTLEKPVKEVKTSTSGVLKNTTGAIKEGIGNILGDLF